MRRRKLARTTAPSTNGVAVYILVHCRTTTQASQLCISVTEHQQYADGAFDPAVISILEDQNLLIVFSFFSFQDICGRSTSAHYQRMCVPEARGGNAQTFSENLTRVTREDFFLSLPVHSPKNSKTRLTKKYKQKLPLLCVLELLLRDSDSKNLAKEKGRRVRGRRKRYLSTPLLSLSRVCVAHFVI
jgi:hypothetical protein